MRFVTVLALALPFVAFGAEPIELTQDEFKMFRHWQRAMSDPQVEAIKPSHRNSAIARDAGFKLKEMERAIEKGEAAGDLRERCEAAVKESLVTGMVEGRVLKVEVDTHDPHAIAYVEWSNGSLGQLEEEASFVASLTAKNCPIVSTIQVSAQDRANPTTRVFQGLISRKAAAKINPERSKDFADTRYIRLFERVQNVAYGDSMNETGHAAPNPSGGGGAAGGQK